MSTNNSSNFDTSSLAALPSLSTTVNSYEDDSFASDLQRRCQMLVQELEEFQTYLKLHKKEDTVELRRFKNDVTNELKLIERLQKDAKATNQQKAIQTLKSSNFPFYDAVWDVAKSFRQVVALRKRFYWNRRLKQAQKGPSPKNLACSAVVDVVSDGGKLWTKISTVTERKIILDLARAGCVDDESEDDSEDDSEDWAGGEERKQNYDDDDDDGLLKQITCLAKASKDNKSDYVWPRINLVLTRVPKECQKPTQNVLNKIRALHVNILFSSDTLKPKRISEAFQTMVVNPLSSFSDVLNIDCTMLLAFVSDLSHGQVEREDWHHKFLSRQMEMESKTQLLPDCVWPACGTRELVCTKEAAKRMEEIVDEIGTVQERQRAKILLSTEPGYLSAQEERVSAFQELSQYAVPKKWALPINIADAEVDTYITKLPGISKEVMKMLSPLNQSVFLYGWATGRTTISSNRQTVKEIKALIESKCFEDEIRGPHVWLSPMSRSLVGKEKRNSKE